MWTENLRSAYRSLRSARGFALSAVLSLGIGIGGSIAMFTLVQFDYPQTTRIPRSWPTGACDESDPQS